MERPPRGGVGRTAPRDSKRDRSCIHEGPGPVSANANRAARFLGGTFQVAGDEEPTTSDERGVVSGEVVVGIMADLGPLYEPNTSRTWSFVAAQKTLRKPIQGT